MAHSLVDVTCLLEVLRQAPGRQASGGPPLVPPGLSEARPGCPSGAPKLDTELPAGKVASSGILGLSCLSSEVLLSCRFPEGMTYEDLFSAVLDEFLKRHDPVLRAGRRANRR